MHGANPWMTSMLYLHLCLHKKYSQVFYRNVYIWCFYYITIVHTILLYLSIWFIYIKPTFTKLYIKVASVECQTWNTLLVQCGSAHNNNNPCLVYREGRSSADCLPQAFKAVNHWLSTTQLTVRLSRSSCMISVLSLYESSFSVSSSEMASSNACLKQHTATWTTSCVCCQACCYTICLRHDTTGWQFIRTTA